MPQPPQADLLFEIGCRAGLCKDQHGDPFAVVEVGDHVEVWPLHHRAFGLWLRRLFREETGKVPNADALRSALHQLEAQAVFEGQTLALHNRVAQDDEAFWYDLTAQDWAAVKMEPGSWEVHEFPPVLFRRQQHQQPQPRPVRGGDPRQLFDFLNVAEGDQLLLLGWAIASLVPDIAHPIVGFHGPKGSAKSTSQRLLGLLIDPSATETLTLPRDVAQLVQLLSHHYCPVFDNVDGLPSWISDALCRAVTGEGMSKRRLYTDDDDVIYSYRRVILMNGINIVAQRPDLLDRSILIGLERVADGSRRGEHELLEGFRVARPSILGGMIDTLAAAMQLVPEVEVSNLPRMADFARWGEAIARALGHEPGEFLAAYQRNQERQVREAVDASTVAQAVMALMEGISAWDGTATELLQELERVGEDVGLFHRSAVGTVQLRGFPTEPHVLVRRLKEVSADLEAQGLGFETYHRKSRGVKLWWLDPPDESVESVDASSADATDATDATDALRDALALPVEEVIR